MVEIVRLPVQNYFDEANRWYRERSYKYSMGDFFNGVLDTRNDLFELIIIIQDRSNNQQNVEVILDNLISRQGMYVNLEAVICYDYAADPGILSTSSDDEDSDEDNGQGWFLGRIILKNSP